MNSKSEFLTYAARLLLEFNDSTGEIHRTLQATNRALSDEKCNVVVSYDRVAVSLGHEAPVLMNVSELRYNAALQAHVHSILTKIGQHEIDLPTALAQLQTVELETPRHPRWLATLLLGFAGAALAALLGGDLGTIFVVGLSTAIGLAARQRLGLLHFNLFTLPFIAAFIGAFLGGLAVRFGWTRTPGLAVIVPSLMLVPGPHLINGLLDIVDNFLPMALARLGLAGALLVVCATGIVFGMELTFPVASQTEQVANTEHLNFVTDMILAGIVTSGFAIFYNVGWSHLRLAVVGGMIGHGLRYLLLSAGCQLEVATFFGALAVGMIAAWIARAYWLPIAVVSFAGAVTMMPGIQIYRALGGMRQIAHLRAGTDYTILVSTLGDAFQSCLVIAALAAGLVIAAKVLPAHNAQQAMP